MSKFFIFFLCSFMLHLALGGVLLYRSGLIGQASQVEVETTSTKKKEGGLSLEGRDSAKESELVGGGESPPSSVKATVKEKVIKQAKKTPKPKRAMAPEQVEPALSSEAKPPTLEPVMEEPAEVAEEPEAEEPPILEPKAKPSTLKPVAEEPAEATSEPVAEEPSPEPVEELSASSDDLEPHSLKNENPYIENQPVQMGMGVTPATARVFNRLKQLPGNPSPEYPKEALEQSWEGRVEVLYYVNTGGFVEQIQVSHSSGHIILDNAAIKALSRYRYELGQEGWVRHPVEFFLEKDKEIKEIVPLRTMDDPE